MIVGSIYGDQAMAVIAMALTKPGSQIHGDMLISLSLYTSCHAVTPEELEQVTPAHLLTTPLATWERNRLQNLLQAISARGAQLRSDHKALAKQVREHENKVSWAASTVDKGLSEVQVKLAAELLDHEAGSQLLGVASKLMEQAKVQVSVACLVLAERLVPLGLTGIYLLKLMVYGCLWQL